MGRREEMSEHREAMIRVLSEEAAKVEPTFGPFFAARVMHRLARERDGGAAMYESLRWMFARVALAGLVACLGLGFYNTVIASNAEIGRSAIESALGVPAENLETVYLLASD